MPGIGRLKVLTPSDEGLVLDPICGMRIAPASAAGRAEHAGTTYDFCSAGCLARFTKDPAGALAHGPGPGHHDHGGHDHHEHHDHGKHKGWDKDHGHGEGHRGHD